MKLPATLYSAEQVRALDRCAIDEFKTPGIDLMERAGNATFQALRRRWPGLRHIAVFCGGGNNGGDGFVIARLAKQAGLDVQVCLLADEARIKGDAQLAYTRMRLSLPVIKDIEHLEGSPEIIVDAILGTGLSGEIEGPLKSTIDWINRQKSIAGTLVVAVDIPSGLHADTGRILGTAVRADLTVTFIGVKAGLLTASGPDCCGELVFDDLQVNPDVYRQVPVTATLLTADIIGNFFSRRTRSSHKGSNGHVLIVGGNYGMAGAVRLAGEAALRCGAGMVTVASRPEHVAAVVSGCPELMCHGLPSSTKELTAKLKSLMESASCIVVGPGLGKDEWARQIFSVIRESRLPTIIDADALNLLAIDFDNRQRNHWIITPHPGEAGRLLNVTADIIQRDRFAAIRALHTRYAETVVLKGNGSLIMNLAGNISLCTAGNPGMATAGMGDVLSGVVAACVAQTGQIDSSAEVATLLHSTAADLAAEKYGERGIMASDLFPHLHQLVNS